MKHQTSLDKTELGYVWSCACGQYDFHIGMSYRVASAGAKRHRAMASAHDAYSQFGRTRSALVATASNQEREP